MGGVAGGVGGLALIGLVYYFKFRKPKEGDGRLNRTSDDGPFDLDVDLKKTQVGTLTF